MTFKFLKIMGIGLILSVKKLLPILFLFTGFQANAVVIGNLTYDGTYISGDGRTYLGLDTIAPWDYATTLAATQVNGEYEDYRIANTADADYFIGSLFGANADNCSTVDGTASAWTVCGHLAGWSDGLFGMSSHPVNADAFFFIADETGAQHEFGLVIAYHQAYMHQSEGQKSRNQVDMHSQNGVYSNEPIGFLLLKDTIVQANEPSILAIMGLGIFGLGYARRRRQS
jgi:hypothetical protein